MSPLGNMNHPKQRQNNIPLISMKSLPLHAQAVDLCGNLFKSSQGSNSKISPADIMLGSPDVFGEKAPRKMKRSTSYLR